MRFGGIRSHEDNGLRVSDVVVGVGHRAVAPGIRDAGDRGRMADASLVIDRVGAPERRELAEQIAALIGEFRGAEQIDGVGAGLGADLEHLVADLVDGLIPRQALPLTIDQLHRIFQPAIAMHEFADRGALGAMRAAIDRAIPGRLLTDPDAVLNLGDHGAADRAMRADVLFDFGRRSDDFRAGLRLAHRSKRHQTQCRTRTRGQTGPLQKRTAVENARSQAGGDTLQTRPAGGSISSLDQHVRGPINSG